MSFLDITQQQQHLLRPNFHPTSLIRNLIHIPINIPISNPLPLQPHLHLRSQIRQVNQHPVLLRMSLAQTQLLDPDLAHGQLVVAQDRSEGDAVLLRGLELRGELGLEFVGEFGLRSSRREHYSFGDR